MATQVRAGHTLDVLLELDQAADQSLPQWGREVDGCNVAAWPARGGSQDYSCVAKGFDTFKLQLGTAAGALADAECGTAWDPAIQVATRGIDALSCAPRYNPSVLLHTE